MNDRAVQRSIERNRDKNYKRLKAGYRQGQSALPARRSGGGSKSG